MSHQPGRPLRRPSPPAQAREVMFYVDDSIVAKKWAETVSATMMAPPTDAGSIIAMAALLEKLSLDRGFVSQRDFWRLYRDIQGDRGPDLWVIDGQHRFVAVELKATRNRLVHGAEEIEASLSAKGRSEILATLHYFLTGDPGAEPTIDEVRTLLAEQVSKRLVVRVRQQRRSIVFNVPSTESWAHNFMLHTGISPPVVGTSNFLAFTTNLYGDFRASTRSCSIRHRRWPLDWRPVAPDGESCPSHRSSFARRSHSGRRERLCLPLVGRQWPLQRSSRGQMGGHLRYVQQWA